MVVIGITGTLGAGKGTIVNYLQEKYGFLHFSVRAFLIKKILKDKLPNNRDSMVKVANELRKKNGASFITDQLYMEAVKKQHNCIIESIRTLGEILSLRKNGNFILFAVDADSLIRYQRIKLRGSETDKIEYEVFIENEKREFDTFDPHKQNLKKCIEMADFTFTNNLGFKELQNEIDKVLLEIFNKLANNMVII